MHKSVVLYIDSSVSAFHYYATSLNVTKVFLIYKSLSSLRFCSLHVTFYFCSLSPYLLITIFYMLLLPRFFNSASGKTHSSKPVTVLQVTASHFFMDFQCLREMIQLSLKAHRVKIVAKWQQHGRKKVFPGSWLQRNFLNSKQRAHNRFPKACRKKIIRLN